MNYSLVLGSGLLACAADAQEHSQLWGSSGESWASGDRLPDFSFAGYQFGEFEPPRVEIACSVMDFGAVGDGEQDDTQAFKDAIEQTGSGAIFVPPGRYKITDILWIEKPHVVLRGAGPEASVLFCPIPLETIRPNMSATTEGRPTSNYSWSGGMVWIKGKYDHAELSPITSPAQRGDVWLAVESSRGIDAGDVVLVAIQDDSEKTLVDYLYSGDPGDTDKLSPAHASMRARVLEVEDHRIRLERPLAFDVRPEWRPKIKRGGSTVYESGIEDLGFEFPTSPYEGHFTELGHNAIAISNAVDCWARNIRIVDGDSGIFLRGYNCTVDGVLIESNRPTDDRGFTGHHGLDAGRDCLVQNFDIRTRFIHDLTVDNFAAGNVFKNGRGVDLTLDHHKKAPYQNLFANLDCGVGSNVWLCGGGAALGKHCGARGTFWGLKAEKNISPPPDRFGPPSMIFVGLTTDTPSTTDPDGVWWEAIPPAELTPIDLHAAQLQRRLAAK